MYGGLTIMECVDLDFTRARRKAFFGLLARRFGFGAGRDTLLDFDGERKFSGASVGRRLGRRTVEVSRIVGSVGRSGDFDGRFMPKKARLRGKWEHVDLRFRRGEESPAVSLYKIGEEYFVSDGNHRISVARFHGIEMVEAEITEYRPLATTANAPDKVPSAECPPRKGRKMAAEKV